MARSPLFDIYDPYDTLSQQSYLPDLGDGIEPLGLIPLSGRKPSITDLMPEEQQTSLLRNLASAGSSGLSALGWLLDTPGSVVRGTLSGGPLKGLSALWETSDDRVTGRELLRQYGLAGSEDNWANFGGGLAAEALLDPLTYMSLGLNQVVGKGAKTLAGNAAQKAGLLQDFDLYARKSGMGTREAMRRGSARKLLDNIADEGVRSDAMKRFTQEVGADAVESALDAPLARMNRLTIPGMKADAFDLFGENFGDWAAKASDKLGEGVMTNPITGPVARGLTKAFDADVLGQMDYDRQWEARELVANRRAAAAPIRRQLSGLQMDAEKALNEAGSSLNNPEVSSAIRTLLERGEDAVSPDAMEFLSLPGVRQFVDFFDEYRELAPQTAKSLGVPLNEFRSRAGTGFVPRQQSRFAVGQKPDWPAGVTLPDSRLFPYSRGNKPANLADNFGRSRRDYTDVMDGTDTLNAMSLDPELQWRLRGASREESQDLIREWAYNNLTGGEGDDLYSWIDQLDTSAQDQIGALRAELDRKLQRAGGPTAATAKLEQRIAELQPLADDPPYVYKAPDLPVDHPLSRQMESLQQQLERAQSMEAHKLPEIQSQIDSIAAQIPEAQRAAWRDKMYGDLGDMLRKLDPQHADKGVPIFGQNTFDEIARYTMGRGRVESDARSLMEFMKRNADLSAADAVEGGVNYKAADALKMLGFTGEEAQKVLARQLGVSNLDNVSFNKKFVDDWVKPIQRAQTPPELNPLLEAADNFTKSFKTLALLWPSRYTRDSYSGAFASAMKGSFNPVDWYVGTQLRKGNYDPLTKPMLGGLIPPRLQGVPEYEELLKTNPEEAARKFLLDAAEQGLGSSTFTDELSSGADTAMRGLYPGASKPTWADIGRRAYNPERTWMEALSDFNPFAIRTGGGNRNPLLELGDRAAETTDAGNRLGTYLNQIRQGAAPSEAKRIADLTQVRYDADAFSPLEQDVLKRVFPFYSYTRGIMPLIGDELVNKPAGLMGLSTRAINRAGEPSENNFTPEYLRQSAAIPLLQDLPFVGLGKDSSLVRYLTNIDLPFESVINLFTPGVGNTLFDKATSGLQKTAMNILGQTNPLIKGPMELATNRQFYSGRQLSDLYSMFEQDYGQPGRLAEQVAFNLPGGSRILGTARQLLDDRLSPQEKWSKVLVNALTGLKFQDVDQERTRRLAARDMLNQLLETTPGVRTYENITVPEDVLKSMPKQQQDMYLLYKIIQAEAAKRARDKKKAETALDPLQVLGVLS